MTDTASLVARVKTEGVTEFNKQLDQMTGSASRADKAVNDLVPSVNRTNTAAGKTASDGLAKMRTAAGQVGYQVQDLVVQLQSGQSAFVAIGQQGSQLAGAFGPGGAVLGAVIALASAVGGVLYNSFGTAKTSTEELEKATKSLKAVLEDGAGGAKVLTDEILKLASANMAAAQAQLAASLADAQTQINAAGQAAGTAAGQFDTFFSAITKTNANEAAVQLKQLSDNGLSVADMASVLSGRYSAASAQSISLYNYTNQLQESLGLSKEQAIGLVGSLDEVSRSKSPEAVQTLARNVADLAAQNGLSNQKLNEFNNVLQTASSQMQQGADSLATLKKLYADLGAQVDVFNAKQKQAGDNFVASLELQSKRGADAIKARAEQQKKEINETDKLDADQKARALAAIQKNSDTELKELADRENKKTEKVGAAAEKRLKVTTEHDEKEKQRQQTQADEFLAQIDRQNGDEINRINTSEQQKLDTLQKYYDTWVKNEQTGQKERLISDAEFQKARTEIEQTAADARTKIAENAQAKVDKITASADPIEKIRQERDARYKIIAEYEQLETANHQTAINARAAADKAYEDATAAAMEARYRSLSASNDILMTSIDAVGASASSSITGLITGTTTAEQAVKNLGAAIIGSVVDGLVDMGVQYVKNMIIGQAMAASNVATATAAGSAMATAYAPAAALASLASFGGNSVPAMAGIGSTVAFSQGMALAAREQGGSLAAGRMSTIAERNKPEVIMPAGASRVRTAQQMRQIMGESSGNSSSSNNGVIIVNNTSARIDTAQTERDDEGRLRVIIRELVANDLQDSNSSISKSRRATRGQAGF